jgi:uncharacterized protein
VIRRDTAFNEIFSLMKQFPAVALLGARQAGKTNLAREIAGRLKRKTVFFDLERSADRARLHDPETVLPEFRRECVVIDEAQAMPELFTALRPLIDADRRAGRFLLLGSVSPHLVKGISETLAGRISHFELGPVNAADALKAGYSIEHLWLRGGYPEALTLRTSVKWQRWAESYFQTFVHRDVNFLMGEALSPSLVNNLWQMLSGIHGGLLNHEMLARSLGITRPTVTRYLDFLEGSYIIHRLQPWFLNATKRVVKSAKVYFRDTAVLHYLNRVDSLASLKSNIIAGLSWEGFVIEQVRQLRHRSIDLYYYRTHHGAETDLLLVKGMRPIACIEIKLGATAAVSRGWHEVIADMKTRHNFVITSNGADYPIGKTGRTCDLQTFLTKYLPKIR